MSTAVNRKTPPFLQKVPRRFWLCLLLAAAMLAGAIGLYAADSGEGALLNEQVAALSAAQTQLETLETAPHSWKRRRPTSLRIQTTKS